MKLPAFSCLNQPVDSGKTRTRTAWQKWGESRLTDSERAQGWVCVVACFGDYFRVNFAAQPIDLRVKLNGNLVR
jgi:hypothetical protein